MKNEIQQTETRRLQKQALERRKRKRDVMIKMTITAVIIVILGISVLLLVKKFHKPKSQTKTNAEEIATAPKGKLNTSTAETTSEIDTILASAATLAAGYDYDKAITALQTIPNYKDNADVTKAISEYEATKASCVPVNIDTVPHIFYHSLINNPDKVFDGDYKVADYNCWYTTIPEFKAITKQMYDRGFVIVRMRDLVIETKAADGTVHFKKNTELKLPPNKKAVVLSIDDLSYYHFGEADGFPDRIVLDSAGKPKCLVKKEDGTEDIGDYDVVPLLNTFLEEHPDGAYRGARGLIALTGYNGILGYRTDIAYKTGEKLDGDQKEWLAAHPKFDWNKDVADAKVVAEGIKKSGWEFASHTWGHARAGSRSAESLKEDNEKWMNYVSPLIGPVDTIIFAHGEDIGGNGDYAPDNPKYTYFKSQGFNFYCNVDSNTYWQQITDSYMRQGRRDLDGYLLYKSMTKDDNLEDLFHVKDVFDPIRPTPVTLAE